MSWGRPATGAVANPAAEIGPPGHRHPIPERVPEISRRAEIGILTVGVLALLALNAPFMPVLSIAFMPEGGIRVSLPLLFASGVAAIVAFLAWKSWHMLRRANEAFHGMVLRRAGRVTAAGWAWLAMSVAVVGVVAMVGAQNVSLMLAARMDRRVDLPPGVVFTRDAVVPSDAILRASQGADRFYEFASLIGRGGIGFVPSVQPWIDLRRSWMAAARRDFVGCEWFLRSAWAGFPADSPLRPDLAADIGRVLWVTGQLTEMDAWYAEQFAANSHASNPAWERTHRDRVTLAMHDEDTPRAIRAAREWTLWDPSSLEAMRRLSLLLVEKGSGEEIDEGIAIVHRTLEIEPGNPGAWRAIAIGHARLERFDEAEAALQKTVELAPDDWRFWQALGELQRGVRGEQASERAFDRATRLREAELNAR